MGIDDNWTDSDQVYTHNARTDTLFLLTLDLANQQASMLSIPRDTYCHIAGTRNRYLQDQRGLLHGRPAALHRHRGRAAGRPRRPLFWF